MERSAIIIALASLLGLCASAFAAAAAGSAKTDAGKLILSSPLTHSDWVLKDGIDTGAEGVRHMLDMCKAAGWSRIYWRVLDSGRSLYPSKLRDPMGSPEPSNYFNPLPEDAAAGQPNPDVLRKMAERYHYGEFDSFGEAVRYGSRIGIQVCAWFSINEDDHGYGWASRFAKQHPEFRWVRRDGRPYHSQLRFAFPEVRKHKLDIIKEVVSKYKVAGVFLDWIRTGDVRDNPQVDDKGVADFGYEKPMVEGFKAKYEIDPHDIPNDDPRWVQYRAEPITEFVRSVRKYLKSARPEMPLAVMVQHPWGYRGAQQRYADNPRGLLLDVKTWAKEGLMDDAVAAGYYKDGGTPEKAYSYLKDETEGKVNVWYYGWVPGDKASFDSAFDEATKLGASQILFWEADYIDNLAHQPKADLQKYMFEKAVFPAPNPHRTPR